MKEFALLIAGMLAGIVVANLASSNGKHPEPLERDSRDDEPENR